MSKKHEAPFVRSYYNYDTAEVSDATGFKNTDPTMTQQQFKDDADINSIMDRFLKTGVIPQVQDLPQAGDFTGIYDFQTMQNAIIDAHKRFLELPSKVRARFDHDPGKLIDFLENLDDPEVREEAQFLGILRRPEQAPAREPAAATPQPPSDAPKDPKGG